MDIINEETRFVVLDVETTGLNPRFGDRICEVGLVLAQGDQIEETYSSLVNPQRPISPGAAAVNGLSDDLLVNAPLFSQIVEEVLARIKNRILICHNVPFDLSFLEMETSRLGKQIRFSSTIDTLQLARNYGHFYSNSLGAIAKQLKLETTGAHRALADALTTFQVWQYFKHSVSFSEEPLIQPFQPGGTASIAVQIPLPLHEAIDSQRDVEIVYVDRNGFETTRLIRPIEAFVVGGTTYLVAYCYLRQDNRQFRLDRIVSINPTMS